MCKNLKDYDFESIFLDSCKQKSAKPRIKCINYTKTMFYVPVSWKVRGIQVVKTSKVLGNLKDCLPFSTPWKKGPEERARLSCKQKKVESKELANVSFQPIYSYIQSSSKIGDLICVVKVCVSECLRS